MATIHYLPIPTQSERQAQREAYSYCRQTGHAFLDDVQFAADRAQGEYRDFLKQTAAMVAAFLKTLPE